MNKINSQLDKIRSEQRLGVMTHIVIGYPSISESKKQVIEMEKAGVDFIELQIPFSDPMADGETIMTANKVALDNGTKVFEAFKLMKELTAQVQIPLLFMSYYNILFRFGIEEFCKKAKEVGASGLIIPDIPLEEEINENFLKYCKQYNLIPIRLLSPASTDERIEKNAKIADGFVYFISRKGTTGSKLELDQNLKQNLKNLKKYISKPIAVGFGISTSEHIKLLKGNAEIAVIGSEIINVYNRSKTKKAESVGKFLKSLLEYT